MSAAFTLEYEVIPDTSCLCTDRPDVFVAPGFTAAWQQCTGEGTFRLLIPSVVVGELMHQKYESAMGAVENAKKNLRTLGQLTGMMLPQLPTDDKIRAGIQAQSKKWLLGCGGTELETPIEHIQWSKLVEDSIWRNLPFDAASNSEKGFRDRLILETVIHRSQQNPSVKIAFIVGDRLLQEAAKLVTSPRLQVFDTAGKFSSEVKLLALRLEQDFASRLLGAAAKAFYDPGSKDCLLLKDDLVTRTVARHPGNFVSPNQADTRWTALETNDRLEIGETVFDCKEGKDWFRWRSSMTFSRSYWGYLPTTAELASQIVRDSEFTVLWKSIIDSEQKIGSPTVIEIVPSAPRFWDILGR